MKEFRRISNDDLDVIIHSIDQIYNFTQKL
jgi:hypothetical protein